MYIKKTCGCVLRESGDSLLIKGLLDIYIPETHKSTFWKYWRAILDPKLCLDCLSHHGKVYAMDEIPDIEPPLHDNCRCAILPMEAITPGGATKDGENGADYWLTNFGKLPDYYISKEELYALGWKDGKSVASKAPGKMVLAAFMKMMMDTFPLLRDESGTKQISTIMKDAATSTGSSFPTMA